MAAGAGFDTGKLEHELKNIPGIWLTSREKRIYM